MTTKQRFLDLPSFEGELYFEGQENYEVHRYQYALSSSENPDEMKPGFILYPTGDEDVLKAVEYARKKKIKVAVRTGGHQYSGMSSTSIDNILLDMSRAYLTFDYPVMDGLLKTGISFPLREFAKKLKEKHLFVPHGQCSHVHLGGHVQTGGWGQLVRCFGLLGDYVEQVRVITYDPKGGAVVKIANRKENTKLFKGILGGSPGNFGVLTHVWVRPLKDQDHEGSRGWKALYPYSKERLKKVLDYMLDTVCQEDFPKNYDLCVTVLSSSQVVLPHLWPNVDEEMKEHHEKIFGKNNELPLWPPVIVIFAQWVRFNNEEFDPWWFDGLKNACESTGLLSVLPPILLDWQEQLRDKLTRENVSNLIPPALTYENGHSMSEIMKNWTFRNVREFLLPYEKRGFSTNWTASKLKEKNFTTWVTERVDELQSDPTNGCKVQLQVAPHGGIHSALKRNEGNGTAYSWRDTSMFMEIDAFYETNSWFGGRPAEIARKWQERNEKEVLEHFCDEDRRLIWASWGDKNLANVAHCYFTPSDYSELCEIKKEQDPERVFCPNSFCVGEPAKEKKQATQQVRVDDSAMVTDQLDKRVEHLESKAKRDIGLQMEVEKLKKLSQRISVDKENMEKERQVTNWVWV